MGPEVIQIGPEQLAIGLVFILVAGIASICKSLNLEKDLIIGTIRTFAQLFLMGYILRFIFKINNAALVLTIFTFMIFFAAWTIYGRIKERQISFFLPVFFSMLLSFTLVAFVVTYAVIQVKPWWTPQYFIPLGGMVIGNSMNAIAIALERLLGELRSKRKDIEMMLAHGANYKEASDETLRDAMKAGMIPSINSMMAVGIVFIPGMMTGQILAGTDPVLAIKYQIVIMIMIVGATATGTLITILIIRKLCFNHAQQLILK